MDVASAPFRTCQQGFSYIEILIASMLIGIILVPALQALQSGSQGAILHQQYSIDQQLLASKMEQLLANEYNALSDAAMAAGDPTTLSSYSDTVISTDGRTLNRQVYLSPYDGDNADNDNNPFTGTDSNLLWLRVAIENSSRSVESLTRQ